MKAIKRVFPDALIQRCLVHIKRQARNYLSNRPQTQIAKELLFLFKRITTIKTLEQSYYWLVDFYNWYTHKNLHAACNLIIKAIPNMYNYLDDPEILHTTNRIENYFAHLKEKITLHRGLRFESKKNFIKWYLHFKNNPDVSFVNHKAYR